MTDAERTCDKCGKTFKSDGAWYAKHALGCDGTPARSGRITSAERTPPAAKRAGSSPHLRSKNRNRRSTMPRKRALVPVPAAPTALSSLRVTFLGQLHEARERIDTAITAVEALG